jgi:HAD superfamily hydrolase (TIGR01549 family)
MQADVKSAHPLQAVTFDVDGTLYSIRWMVVRNFASMLPVMGFFRELHKVRAGLRGEGPFEDFRAEQARRLAVRLNTTRDQAARQVERVIDGHWMRVFKKVRPFQGVRNTLETLINRGLPVGLISDYPLGLKLEGMGLGDLPFTAFIGSEEVGALKPHPASFLRAAEKLGVEPGGVLHVGDREDCDVTGALAAGMRAALFKRKKKTCATRAEFTFSDWRMLVPLLEARGLIC